MKHILYPCRPIGNHNKSPEIHIQRPSASVPNTLLSHSMNSFHLYACCMIFLHKFILIPVSCLIFELCKKNRCSFEITGRNIRRKLKRLVITSVIVEYKRLSSFVGPQIVLWGGWEAKKIIRGDILLSRRVFACLTSYCLTALKNCGVPPTRSPTAVEG